MAVEPIHDEGQQLPPPTGKVLGVVESQDVLDSVSSALQKAGFDKLVSLHGQEGLQLLERVQTFFRGDCEEVILKRHIQHLKDGHSLSASKRPAIAPKRRRPSPHKTVPISWFTSVWRP